MEFDQWFREKHGFYPCSVDDDLDIALDRLTKAMGEFIALTTRQYIDERLLELERKWAH